MRRAIAVALTCCALLSAAVVGVTTAAPAGPVVRTLDGRVRGSVVGRADEFLGIPYAAPPVGPLRWRPPQPVRPWGGIRQATTPPPRCAQQGSGVHPPSLSESCLHLSVYRPRGTTAEDRLPVLFWIHGGALASGSSNQNRGTLFATTDHIVVVSIDYRLGPLGYLNVPGLEGGAPVPGDFGLLDQEAALRWTRANIARFGGDPRAITLAGESAGAYSVCALLTVPSVRGLFARAIMQSGSCRSDTRSHALRHGEAFARAVGCRRVAGMAGCLRGLSIRRLLADTRYPPDHLPIAGVSALPMAPARALARGDVAHVPVLIGTNRDEARLFSKRWARAGRLTYDRIIHSQFGREAPRVLAHYPWRSFRARYRTAYALGAVWTDSGRVYGIGGCGEQRIAQELSSRDPTWFYEFDARAAPAVNRTLPGYRLGAGHTAELPFMWPSYNSSAHLYARLTPAQRELSRWMLRYWGAFVRAGDPAVGGQAPWPSYGRSGMLMRLLPGAASHAVPGTWFAAEHRCAFWDSLRSGGDVRASHRRTSRGARGG
jgi:carboxylesterase type B